MLLDNCVPPGVRIDTTILKDNVVQFEARLGGYAVVDDNDDDDNDNAVTTVAATTTTTNDTTTTTTTNENSIPSSIVEQRTKAWVKRLLVELQICPFTKSVTKSGQGLGDLGVPVARIAYHTSGYGGNFDNNDSNNDNASRNNQKNVYQLLADTWRAIDDMIVHAGPSGSHGISSILLAAPGWDDDWEAWSGPLFAVLEQCVVAARAESHVGVVCFHPRYATPDGTSWPGFGQMHSVPRLQGWVNDANEKEEAAAAKRKQGKQPQPPQQVPAVDGLVDQQECPAGASSSTTTTSTTSLDDIAAGGAWQRRTPHATINVLRANQLAVAESRRNTPQLYARNVQTLMDIGNEQLSKDLMRERNMMQ